jgi:hypothetical protein
LNIGGRCPALMRGNDGCVAVSGLRSRLTQQDGADGARDVSFPVAFRSRIRGWRADLVLYDVDIRRSVLDAPLPIFPIAIHDVSPNHASRPRAR